MKHNKETETRLILAAFGLIVLLIAVTVAFAPTEAAAKPATKTPAVEKVRTVCFPAARWNAPLRLRPCWATRIFEDGSGWLTVTCRRGVRR